MKSWLKDHDIKIYSTHNEGKSVVAERFMRTLKNKIYKYMTSVSKNVYIDKLDNIANRYNSAYQTKMKPLDLKSNTYIYPGIENNSKHSKFKVGDHVRIENYKNIFTKGYVSDWSEEILLLWKSFMEKSKVLYDGHILLVIWMVKTFLEHFVKKNCKRQIRDCS